MATALKQFTTDEFLLWAEGREGRWELFDGVPAMMAPERARHAETKAAAFVALSDAIRRAGLPCRAYPDGMAVRIDRRSSFEPDASVICGKRPHPDALTLDDPVVVVEVLSPTTAAVDHGPKLAGYFSLPSVAHYLILDPDRRMVVHHRRGEKEIETRVLTEGVASLDPPGFEVAVAAMFPPPDEA